MAEARTRRRKTVDQPYPGLRPFLRGENLIFFGREGQTDELIGRLRQNHFLAVLGSSGSGKSSLVRAGLLPALEAGLMAGARSHWKMAVIRPGEHPIRYLADALAELVARPDDPSYQILPAKMMIETMLQSSSFGLKEAAMGPILQDNENLLVVVDQFEEIFRFNEDNQDPERLNEAKAFVRLLLEASSSPALPIYVVITMRSDFLGECPRFNDLPEAINAGQYLVPRLTRAQLREAITGPAAVFREEIAPDLVIRLLNDLGDNPDQLPILQHALMRTWDHHKLGTEISIADYEAIGGLQNALNQHAEEIYDELRDQGLAQVTEALFKSLTEMETEGKGIRRPTRLSDVCARAGVNEDKVKQVVDAFRAPGRSFLMPPAEVPLTQDTILDISHESFMRLWARLNEWVREEYRSAEEYYRLSTAAMDHKLGKVNLWRQPELGIALKWRETMQPNAAWASRYDQHFAEAMAFLDNSLAAWEKEEAEKAAVILLQRKSEERKKTVRRLSLLIFMLAAMLVLITSALIYAVDQSRYAQEQKQIADQKADTLEIQIKENVRLLAQATKDKDSIRTLQEKTDVLNVMLQMKLDTISFQSDRLSDQVRAILATKDSVLRVKNMLAITNKDLIAARKIADDNANEQLRLRKEADDQAAEAKRTSGRLLALQTAVRSGEAPNKETAALLALRASREYKDLGGDPDDPKIYSALEEVLERFQPQIRYTFPFVPQCIDYIPEDDAGFMISISGSVHQLVQTNGEPRVTDKNTMSGLHDNRFVSHSLDHAFTYLSDLNHRLLVYKNNGCYLDKELIGHTNAITGAVGLPGNIMYSSDIGGYLYRWDLNAQKPYLPKGILSAHGPLHCLAMNSQGTLLAVGANAEIIFVYPTKGGTTGVPMPDKVTALAFSKDGSILIFGMENGAVGYYNMGAEKPVYFPIHKARVTSIAFSPDGQYMATGSMDQTVRLFHISRLETLPIVLRGHKNWVVGLGFSNDSRKLYSISKDKTMRTWYTHSEDLVLEIEKWMTRTEFTDDEAIQYQLPDKRVKGDFK